MTEQQLCVCVYWERKRCQLYSQNFSLIVISLITRKQDKTKLVKCFSFLPLTGRSYVLATAVGPGDAFQAPGSSVGPAQLFSWAPAQIIGMIAVCPVSLQSQEHWGRTEKGGFSKAQEALVAQERVIEEVGG